ncbi:MAG TPA: hypothetical protein PLU99_15570, partial [Phycisphaerae bacterium]|nr:hypothetical protein [Phycisphaerae bacterium]
MSKLQNKRALAAGASLLLLLSGCENFSIRPPSTPPPEPKPPPMAPLTLDPVLAGSIGAATFLSEVDPVEVRGFGLVIGLGKNGS